MSRILSIEPLTQDAFAPFGTVIEADPASMRYINGGTTERFHGLARADVVGEGADVIINIFRGQPRAFPYAVAMMERHPFGSQSFSPLEDRPWLVVVAEDEGADRECRGCSGRTGGRASTTGAMSGTIR